MTTRSEAAWAAWWALAGFVLLLGSAVYRLSLQAIEAFTHDLNWPQAVAMLANIVFMAYSEGYRGFQLRFSPRFAQRAWNLNDSASMRHRLLAPLVAMGLIHAPRRQMIVAWSLTALIVVVVIVFRFIPQPWRGILDAGVVVGLAWGIAATIACFWRARPAASDPEVSAGEGKIC